MSWLLPPPSLCLAVTAAAVAAEEAAGVGRRSTMERATAIAAILSPPLPPVQKKRGVADFEEVVLPLLHVIHAREGHSDVEPAYKVTAADVAAAGVCEVWIGYGLGAATKAIWARGAFLSSTIPKIAEKKQALFARRRAALEAIDFAADGARRFGWLLLALRWYSDTHKGNMDVPKEFVMSEDDCREAGLPVHVGEYRLGQTVNSIRSSGTFVGDQSEHGRQNRVKLDEMRFAWFSARGRGRPQQDP